MLNMWNFTTVCQNDAKARHLVASGSLLINVFLIMIASHIFGDTRLSAIVFQKLLLIGIVLVLFWTQTQVALIRGRIILLAAYLYSNEIVRKFSYIYMSFNTSFL